jgi:hypothetical protein
MTVRPRRKAETPKMFSRIVSGRVPWRRLSGLWLNSPSGVIAYGPLDAPCQEIEQEARITGPVEILPHPVIMLQTFGMLPFPQFLVEASQLIRMVDDKPDEFRERFVQIIKPVALYTCAYGTRYGHGSRPRERLHQPVDLHRQITQNQGCQSALAALVLDGVRSHKTILPCCSCRNVAGQFFAYRLGRFALHDRMVTESGAEGKQGESVED